MKLGGGVFANFQTGANITNNPHQSENLNCGARPSLGDHLYRLATVHAAFLQLLHSIGIGAFPRNH